MKNSILEKILDLGLSCSYWILLVVTKMYRFERYTLLFIKNWWKWLDFLDKKTDEPLSVGLKVRFFFGQDSENKMNEWFKN